VYVRGKQKTGHRSLLRFAYKPFKNRRPGDFLPCKLRNEPDNRGFYGFSTKKAIKTYKRDRLIGFLDAVYQEAWKSICLFWENHQSYSLIHPCLSVSVRGYFEIRIAGDHRT
jgi:hypothetical protein